MSKTFSEILGKRVLLFYPPGPIYQRGEDRSQGNVSDSAATVMRAPNDMGYASAILKEMGSFDLIEFGVKDIVRSGFVRDYILAKQEVEGLTCP